MVNKIPMMVRLKRLLYLPPGLCGKKKHIYKATVLIKKTYNSRLNSQVFNQNVLEKFLQFRLSFDGEFWSQDCGVSFCIQQK